jgi:hypothetical protein
MLLDFAKRTQRHPDALPVEISYCFLLVSMAACRGFAGGAAMAQGKEVCPFAILVGSEHCRSSGHECRGMRR